jgi:hypothetical protein
MKSYNLDDEKVYRISSNIKNKSHIYLENVKPGFFFFADSISFTCYNNIFVTKYLFNGNTCDFTLYVD